MKFPALEEIVEVDGEIIDGVEELLDYAIEHGRSTWTVDFTLGDWDDEVENALTSAGYATKDMVKKVALEHIMATKVGFKHIPTRPATAGAFPAEVIQALAGAAKELTWKWFESEEAPDVLERSLESATLVIRMPVVLIGSR